MRDKLSKQRERATVVDDIEAKTDQYKRHDYVAVSIERLGY